MCWGLIPVVKSFRLARDPGFGRTGAAVVEHHFHVIRACRYGCLPCEIPRESGASTAIADPGGHEVADP